MAFGAKFFRDMPALRAMAMAWDISQSQDAKGLLKEAGPEGR